MLKVSHLTKFYTIKKVVTRALNDVSVEFAESGLVAILGPSGCGKTTLMNLIGGMDRQFDGDIMLNIDSLRLMNDEQMDSYRRKRIGFIFQHAAVISSLSVLENITAAMALAGESKEVQVKRAKDLLETFGLKGLENRKMNTLSGGQKQRVVIARALANNPDIILADEPTGELDTASSQIILKTLRQLAQERLVIMVTHEEKFALAIADRIIRMRDGVIVNDEPNQASLDVEQFVDHWTKVQKTQTGSRLRFFDAIKMAYRALAVHGGRTFWTSFGTATGLIGIGLTLSITIGFSNFLKQQLFGNFNVTDINVVAPISEGETRDELITSTEMNSLLATMPSGEAGYVYQVYPSTYYPSYTTLTQTLEGQDVSGYGLISDPMLFFKPEMVDDFLEIHDSAVAYPALVGELATNEVYLMFNSLSIDEADIRASICLPAGLPNTCSYEDIGDYFAAGNTLTLAHDSTDSYDQTLNFHATVEVRGIVVSSTSRAGVTLGVGQPTFAANLLSALGYERMTQRYNYEVTYRGLDYYQEAQLAVYSDPIPTTIETAILDAFINQNYNFEQKWDIMNIDGTFDYYAVTKSPTERILPEDMQTIVNENSSTLLTYVMDSNVTTTSNMWGGGRRFSQTFVFGVDEATNENFLNDGAVDTLNPPYFISSTSMGFEPYNYDKLSVSRQLYDIQGDIPLYTDLTDIVISKALAEDVYGSVSEAIGKTLIASFTTGTGTTYQHIELTVVGVARNSSAVSILQDSRWTNEFFMEYRDVSIMEIYTTASFTLLPQSPAGVSELIDQLNDTYSDYEFSNSFVEILDVVDQVVTGIQVVLISLSSISLLVALLMIAIVTFISVVERTREVGILRAVGARKADIRNLFLIESWGIGVYAALLSGGFVYVIALLINLAVNGLTNMITPGAELEFIVIADMGWIPVTAVIVLSFTLSILAGLFPSHQAASLDPIKALKKR